MGFVLGLVSALCYASASICYRLGQRSRPADDGLVVSSLVNVVVLGAASLFVVWPSWHLGGFLALVAGGVLGTAIGRFAWLRGIRLVGPTRAGMFTAASPVTAAIAAWLILDERISWLEAFGGAVTVLGLILLIRSRADERSIVQAPVAGYLVAAIAPLAFGLAFVFRKLGIEHMPGAVTGAFIGAAAGQIGLLLWESGRGRLRELVASTVDRLPWAFVAAGVATAVALLTQFWALDTVEAWVVAVLGGTVAIWTPFLSMLFLGQDESISAKLFAYIGIVFAGLVVIATA